MHMRTRTDLAFGRAVTIMCVYLCHTHTQTQTSTHNSHPVAQSAEHTPRHWPDVLGTQNGGADGGCGPKRAARWRVPSCRCPHNGGRPFPFHRPSTMSPPMHTVEGDPLTPTPTTTTTPHYHHHTHTRARTLSRRALPLVRTADFVTRIASSRTSTDWTTGVSRVT
jgi:hypothetical protein